MLKKELEAKIKVYEECLMDIAGLNCMLKRAIPHECKDLTFEGFCPACLSKIALAACSPKHYKLAKRK